MRKLKKKTWRTTLKKRPNKLLLFVLSFAGFCVLVLVTIHAASPNISVEPEDGNINGKSSIGSDPLASSGNYVQFGGAQTTVNIPSSIASDCSVDVTPDFNTWFDSLPDNTTAVLKKDACYSTEDQIDLLDKINFTLDGNGATLKRTLRQGNTGVGNHMHLRIARSQRINVKNLIITGEKQDSEGYNSGLEGQHALGLYGVVYGTFDNVRISFVHGDCFYLNRGQINGATHVSQYITIKNSYCHQTGRHGVGFLSTSDVLITRSTFENNHRENFDFEPYGTNQGGGANNVTIDNNDIGSASQLMVSEAGGSAEFKNFTFSNNRLHRPLSIVLEGYSGSPLGPVKIINNKVDPSIINHRGAIVIHGFTNITITGNQATFDSVNNLGEPNTYFVQLFYAHDAEISNNSMIGARPELYYDPFTDTYCGSGNTPNFTNLSVCN